MMTWPWEIITTVADTVLVSLLVTAFKKFTKTAEQISKAPQYEVGKELEEALKEAPDNILPYACVSGNVEPQGKSLDSTYNEQKGVIQRLTLVEHRSKRTQGYWADCTRVIRNVMNITPFKLVSPKDDGVTALVCEPLGAEYLMEDLQTTYDKFDPSQATLMEKGIDRVFGEVSKGFQETEKMLTTGSYLLGLGEVALWKGDIRIMPPHENYRYILSRKSKLELVKHYQTKAVIMKRLAVVFGLVGAAVFTYWAYKKYKVWREKWDMDRILNIYRQERAQRSSHGSPDHLPSEQACVICLNHIREVIVLNCGHVCMCAECADLLPAPKGCPMCREPVTRIQPIFVS